MFTTLPSSLGYVSSFVLIRVTKYRVVSASSYLRDRNIDRRSPRDSIYNFQGKMAKNTSIDIRKEIINKEEENLQKIIDRSKTNESVRFLRFLEQGR